MIKAGREPGLLIGMSAVDAAETNRPGRALAISE
jgi:hypothetical protein